MQKLSPTYRFLRAIGLNYSEDEYGQISLWKVIKRTYKTYRDTFLLKFFMNSLIFSPINPRKLRPIILRKCVMINYYEKKWEKTAIIFI